MVLSLSGISNERGRPVQIDAMDAASLSPVPLEVRCRTLVPLSLSMPNYGQRCRAVDGNAGYDLQEARLFCVLARIAPRLYRHETEARPSDARVSSPLPSYDS